MAPSGGRTKAISGCGQGAVVSALLQGEGVNGCGEVVSFNSEQLALGFGVAQSEMPAEKTVYPLPQVHTEKWGDFLADSLQKPFPIEDDVEEMVEMEFKRAARRAFGRSKEEQKK